MGGVKDKIIFFKKKNRTKNYSKAICVNNMCGGVRKPRKLKKKQLEESIIKNIRNLFKLKKKDKTIRDIKNHFVHQEENRIILLMVPNREGWFYLAVAKLSVLLRQITSKTNDDFYCLNFHHSFRTKNKLSKFHKEVCQNKDFCNAVMLSEDTNTLEFNQYQNPIKHHLSFMQMLNLW